MIVEDARAKINLYLHVGPLREDGLHDLASLFVFTEKGDVVSASPSDTLTLEISGPFGDALSAFPIEDNLVLRAAERLRDFSGIQSGAALKLQKNLPIAAGIGGGSADAAAALRALVKLWNLTISDDALEALAFGLGADIPACLAGRPILVDGAGEQLSAAPNLPPLYVCLVNPGIDMPTGPVFREFDTAHVRPDAPVHPASVLAGAIDISELMKQTRNDLEPPARAINPMIGDVVGFLCERDGVLGARMSGSGATCFALFTDQQSAVDACTLAQKKGWWAMASRLVSA